MVIHNNEQDPQELQVADLNRNDYEVKTEELTYESSQKWIEDDEAELILLQNTKHKNLFLAKVGMVFTVHYTMWVFVSLLVTFRDDIGRRQYWLYRLNISTWVFFIYALGIRFIFAFAGHYVKRLSKFFMLFDFYVTFQLALGLYYYFTYILKTQYIYHGHYVIMFSYVMFFNSIAFTLSCLIKDKRMIYNPYIGFVFLELSTFTVLYIFSYFVKIPTLTRIKYRIVFLLISFLNAYFSLNAYYIVKHRGTKFFDYEHIHCFFCFWTDWIYCFWSDMTRGYRLRQQKLRLALKEQRRKRKEEEKRAKELEEEREMQEDLEDELASDESVIEYNEENRIDNA